MIAPCCGKEVLFLINGKCAVCKDLQPEPPEPKKKAPRPKTEKERLEHRRRLRRESYYRNREAHIKAVKIWRKNNPEKVLKYNEDYKERHPDRVKETHRKCREKAKAKKVNAAGAKKSNQLQVEP